MSSNERLGNIHNLSILEVNPRSLSDGPINPNGTPVFRSHLTRLTFYEANVLFGHPANDLSTFDSAANVGFQVVGTDVLDRLSRRCGCGFTSSSPGASCDTPCEGHTEAEDRKQ